MAPQPFQIKTGENKSNKKSNTFVSNMRFLSQKWDFCLKFGTTKWSKNTVNKGKIPILRRKPRFYKKRRTRDSNPRTVSVFAYKYAIF